jgi:hypothetical protein
MRLKRKSYLNNKGIKIKKKCRISYKSKGIIKNFKIKSKKLGKLN